MNKYGIKNVKIITENEILLNHCIIYTDKILHIGPEDAIKDEELIAWQDGQGHYLAPGFVNIHIHGAGGYDTMDGQVDSIKKIGEALVKNGTTSFLPTTVTMDMKSTVKALETLEDSMKHLGRGARIQGGHLEGPFINKSFKGAHEEAHIRQVLDRQLDPFLPVIKLVTLAPEIEGGEEILNYFKEAGTKVSIGHTNANYEETRHFIKKGISHVTHIFNAMRPLHHREPGVLGAVLTSDITCEVIGDNIHVHSGLYELLRRCVGEDRMVLVTDAMCACGLGQGHYKLGNLEVVVDENSARLESGVLAGSVLTMDKGVRNILEATKMTLCEVIKMATYNPARVIGIDDHYGKIDLGYAADFVLLDDALEVAETIVNGQSVYKR
jgi:N-acetylglucosamine-6-phosphate deacetylase